MAIKPNELRAAKRGPPKLMLCAHKKLPRVYVCIHVYRVYVFTRAKMIELTRLSSVYADLDAGGCAVRLQADGIFLAPKFRWGVL